MFDMAIKLVGPAVTAPETEREVHNYAQSVVMKTDGGERARAIKDFASLKNSSDVILGVVFSIEPVISMGRRRGEVQILTDLLTISLKEVRVTHLMYRSNLSYSTLRRYLLAALKQGLIVKVIDGGGSVVYRTSEKGRLLLTSLNEVKCVLRG
jgi:predicted transcriptional regulator